MSSQSTISISRRRFLGASGAMGIAGAVSYRAASAEPSQSTDQVKDADYTAFDSLVVTGVVTNVCVTQTAREFADRDFQVVVVADACATMADEDHHAALRTFNDVFGHVHTAGAVIELLS